MGKTGIIVLSDKIILKFGGVKKFTEEQENATLKIWQKYKNTKTDEPMMVFAGQENNEILCERINYRHFLANLEQPSLGLGINFLALSGIIVTRDNKVILGKRADDVTQHKGHWELMPSGSITTKYVTKDKTAQYHMQLLEEFTEETGLNNRYVTHCCSVGLLQNNDGSYEIGCQININVDKLTFLQKFVPGEYTEILALRPSAAKSFMNNKKTKVVPTSVALLDIYLKSIKS